MTLATFGTDTSFYDLMEAQANTAFRAAQELHRMIGDLGHADDHAQAIKALEHEGDELTHRLFNHTDATFVTPLDKEDLHALSGALDDVTDYIESTAARMTLYQLTTARPDVEPMVKLLVETTDAMRSVVAALRDLKQRETLQALFERLHSLENQSDTLFRQALGDLFNAPNADPITVMKWKEIYDRVEKAVDKCENVAKVVEGVAVKYA